MDGKIPGVAAAFGIYFRAVISQRRRLQATRCMCGGLLLAFAGFVGCSPLGGGSYADNALDRYPHVVDSKTFEKRLGKESSASKPEAKPAVAATEKAAPAAAVPAAKIALPAEPTAEAMARRTATPNIAITEVLTELRQKEGVGETDLAMFRDLLAEHPEFAKQMLAVKDELAGATVADEEPTPLPQTEGSTAKQLEPGDKVGPAPAIGDAISAQSAPHAAPERIEAKYAPSSDQADAAPSLPSKSAASLASPLPPPATTLENIAGRTPPPPTLETDGDLSPNSPHDWRYYLHAAIEELERQRQEDFFTEGVAQEKNRAFQTHEQVQLRLLYLTAGRNEEASMPIEQLSESPQAFWIHQIQGLSMYLDEKSAPSSDRRAALALRELRSAANALSKDSVLDVRNLAFCSYVQSFGAFTEFPSNRFKPNQETLLYVELENFTVEKKAEHYETTLQASYQMFDPSGRRVAEHTFPVESEICRNQRRDFFIPFRVYMPKRINPGEYTLQLTVEDLKGQKFGQGLIEFTIE